MKVAILGFGVEGQDAARYFLEKGAQIAVFDKKERKEIAKGEWRGANFEWVCGPDYLSAGIHGFDLIVRSPGVYRFIPEIVEVEKNGAKITSNTKIFFDECKTPIIAVTGTKGKGTTSTLITRGLEAAGKKVVLAGNIGEPMLSRLSQANNSDFVILELSSFQTIDLHKSPHIAVVTNITTDHLNWHKDRNGYVNAKENLWLYQTKDDFLVMNKDDRTCQELAKKAPGTVVWYNPKAPLPGDLRVPGKHNRANAHAALAAAKIVGANLEKAWQGIASYKGAEHRLEKVAEKNGVLFINDSAATTPEATIAALETFSQPKILIAGGSAKGIKFAQLAKAIAKNNVRAVLLMGETETEIEKELENVGYKGVVKRGYRDMATLVEDARSVAQNGDIVFLSPACASFGLFTNYQERGQKFKEAMLKSI